MRKILLLIACLGLTTVACNKKEKKDAVVQITDGTYLGTFQRNTVNTPPVPVIFTFSGSSWNGTSAYEKYPALCRGSFTVNGQTVSFTNDCMWTAEFDWTLILKDDFIISGQNDSIVLKKTWGASNMFDQYTLKKIQ